MTDAYLIECDPGVRCVLGRYALLGESGGARLDPDDFDALGMVTDADYQHVGGVFDFAAYGLQPGQSVRVAIPLESDIPVDAVYRKWADGAWATVLEDDANALHSALGEAGHCPAPGDAAWASGLQPGDTCVQLTIEDGGANDADGAADGGIEDPGSVATPIDAVAPDGDVPGGDDIEGSEAAARVPTGGGCGCAGTSYCDVCGLLALVALVGSRRRRLRGRI